MTTLRDFLWSHYNNYNLLLNDGADTWTSDNLYNELRHNELYSDQYRGKSEKFLDQEIEVSEEAITGYDDDGFLKSVPLFIFEKGKPIK